MNRMRFSFPSSIPYLQSIPCKTAVAAVTSHSSLPPNLHLFPPSRIFYLAAAALSLSLSPSPSPSRSMEDAIRSSPISGAGDAYLTADSGSQIGSASGSLKNEYALLSGGGGSSEGSSLSASVDAEFGFHRPEMGRGALVGTVGKYERHVFLCYKSPDVWPSHVEAAEFDRLPRLLSAALAARKPDIKKKTRLTICEGEDGTDASNGDVLIFPDMIRYRRLTHFDVDNFVEEVIVKDTEWLPGAVETLTGTYVFICAHGSRDRRCGVCGPVLIKKFKEEIISCGLQDRVFVSPCSHIGGHKYAGNVIIFSTKSNGEVAGNWYGYVAPDDVPILLEQQIGKGEIVDHLWRGQMGLSEEDQKEAQNLRSQLNGETLEKELLQKPGTEDVISSTMNGGCCQGVGNSSCCQDVSTKEKVENNHINESESRDIPQKKSNKESNVNSSKGTSSRKACGMPTWFEIWEREDTYAVLAVAAAIASVAVAYSCYRQMK